MDVDIGWNSLKKKLAFFFCKHKISQLQKIKQLKRNMVCKYKFVLMNNEYNLFSIFFYKKIPFDSIFFELDLNKRSSWLWLEDGLNNLHNKSLALSLLEICCPSSSSSPLNVFQVLQRLLRLNFSRAWAFWKLGLQNERGCLLFIVILEDKLHLELIYLKVCSKLLIGSNSS